MESSELAEKLKTLQVVHFVGIGGSGMSGAARILRQRGMKISGSEPKQTPITQELSKQGIQVHYGHQVSNLPKDCQLLIHSAAITKENPELQAARERKIPTAKYATLAGALLESRHSVAVAGTHGKTTTTGMIAWALKKALVNPGFLIGGSVPQLGSNAAEGGGRFFVAEACEFDRSFHYFHPEIAVITNIERDHLDYYRDLQEIEESFYKFANQIRRPGTLILGRGVDGQIPIPSQVRAFRLGQDFDCEILGERGGNYRFRLRGLGLDRVGEIQLRIPGKFNTQNASLAAAALRTLGLDPVFIQEGLSSYLGAHRRFTLCGERAGVTVVDDYGHHPTEIRAVLEAARGVFPGRRILLVFQPHQASRTRIFFEEFVHELLKADLIFLPRIFQARDSQEEIRAVSSEQLAKRLRELGAPAVARAEFDDLLQAIEANIQPGDVLLTLGAGNVYEIAERFLRQTSLPRSRKSATFRVEHDAERGQSGTVS